jgi:hypothetical protein
VSGAEASQSAQPPVPVPVVAAPEPALVVPCAPPAPLVLEAVLPLLVVPDAAVEVA